MARSIRLAFFMAVLTAPLHARVISYAPYTDRGAIPTVQSRLNRHFVLVEQTGTLMPVPIGISPAPPNFNYPPSQIVVYDSQGLDEPRVVFPQDGTTVPINTAIAYEDSSELAILVQSQNAGTIGWQMTHDGGKTWMELPLPRVASYFPNGADTGGVLARARFSQILPATHDVPFVVMISTAGTSNSPAGSSTFYGVTFDGSVKQLASFDSITNGPPLLGRDATGSRFLVESASGIMSIDVNGHTSTIANATFRGVSEGWITPDGGAYVEENIAPGDIQLWYAKNGTTQPVAAAWDGPPDVVPTLNSSWVFFAVPTADYSGAWIIRRGGNRPTTLLRHTPSGGLVPQWQDVSAPEVEALHPAQSGTKVLIQVHRPRQTTDNLMFKDPALSVWRIGDPAPTKFDELFLSETLAKGFVHLDVDKIETGDQFVFDSGIPSVGGSIIVSPPPPTAGGGSDVVQEWGVVRASLQQRLVLPGVGHTQGAFGSQWATDVTLQNPSTAPTKVTVNFVPNGALLSTCLLTSPPPPFCSWYSTLTLAPSEVRVIPDAIKSLFNVTNDSGALYLAPDIGSSVNVNSRTYNTTSQGTYGFTMNGIDIYTAAGPRFPVTFAGAFQGPNFRTNLFLTNASSLGSINVTAAATSDGSTANSDNPLTTFASNIQYNSINTMIGSTTGALTVQPNAGDTIASLFVIDNRTNDPTFFPPDLSASVMRVIPAIGHIDGANGSKFRSDLYLFNSSDQPKTLSFQAKLWDVPEQPATLSFTLLPHESRVIRDALLTMFNKTGIARLRFTLQGPITDTSVHVTSRTYTIDANGGTYGFQMPPLNSFQSGSPGDTLEILGATLDPKFRTNLGLVELTAWPNPTTTGRARIDIVDNAGQTIDSFQVDVPTAGGMQINDLFHARNLPDNGKPVLIRVTVIQGTIGAYGAFVDNGTNDPSYVAANLAARG